MTKKKTLYEILEVEPDASYPRIREAYEACLQALEARRQALSQDDYTMQARLLRVAMNSLSSPSSRDAYDAQLKSQSQPEAKESALVVTPSGDASAAAALRADAMLLRAEALALKADAMGMKADIVGAYPVATAGTPMQGATQRLFSSFKTLLLVLGIISAIGMVLRVVFLSTAAQPMESSAAASQAAEKVYLQEYFQTHGVRPASRAEAELMDAERRKKEADARAQREAEAAQYKAERAERDFEEKARRRGQQVSEQLHYADERARLAQEAEEQRKQHEAQMRAEAEARRHEAEQEKWRRVLTTPSTY